MPKVIGRLGLILSTAFLMTGIAAAPASAGTAVTAKKPRRMRLPIDRVTVGAGSDERLAGPSGQGAAQEAG